MDEPLFHVSASKIKSVKNVFCCGLRTHPPTVKINHAKCLKCCPNKCQTSQVRIQGLDGPRAPYTSVHGRVRFTNQKEPQPENPVPSLVLAWCQPMGVDNFLVTVPSGF